MVSEIRIYIEGDRSLKEGFNHFFREIIEIVRVRRIHWKVILCGSRNRAFPSFENALADHPDAFNVLLVDSEAPLNHRPWEHLKLREGDGWSRPAAVEDSQCQLMVQTMESWFVADVAALRSYYGDELNLGLLALPANGLVEAIPKNDLEPRLKRATAKTNKGRYHKTVHALELLKRLNPATVRQASPSCERLFATLRAKIDGTPVPEPA